MLTVISNLFASILLIVASSLSACAQPVVGGQTATNNFHFFCSIKRIKSSNLYCGASLIAPQWILTAGHCVSDYNGSLLDTVNIVIDNYIKDDTNNLVVRSDYIARHKLFTLNGGSLDYDIGLVHLKNPVYSVQPIDLPLQGDNTLAQDGNTVYAIGYGLYDTLSLIQIPDTLRWAQVEIIENNKCNQSNLYNGAVTGNMLCAGKLTGVAKGSASGDSGGPLFTEKNGSRIQLGIVSHGGGPYSTSTKPGVYTRISAFRNWIDSVIKDYNLLKVYDRKVQEPLIQINDRTINVLVPFASKLISCIVYDVTGKKIIGIDFKSSSNNFTIDMKPYTNGLYILRLYATDWYYTHKFSLN